MGKGGLKMTVKDLSEIMSKSDSPTLQPLRDLFYFMNYLNEEHKKENDGKDMPYLYDPQYKEVKDD